MKLEALRKLIESKSIVKLLFNRKRHDVWEPNQKWVVSDYLYLNRESLDLSIEYSKICNATIVDKIGWTNLVKTKDLTKDKSKIVKLLSYYRNILNYIEINGEETVFNYMTSRGMPNKLTSMHFIDMSQDIHIVRDLDEEQQEFIDSVIKTGESENKSHLLLAGPGSGKTTTLSHLVKNLYNSEKRVLILMYNRNIRDHMIKQLKQLGIPGLVKNPTKRHLDNQILVCTLHKYASLFTKNRDYRSDNMIYFKNLQDIQNVKWDYCIVDEIHDVRNYQYHNLIIKIPSEFKVYAGDYMQILYGDENTLKCIHDVSKIHHLKNNYRSCQNIVKVLNNMPHLGVYLEQTAVYSNDNQVIIDKSPMYQENILKYLNEYRPGETFIICPISIRKFGIDKSIQSILDYIAERDTERYRRLHRYKPIGIDGIMRNDTDYILTSKAVKGLERKQVILLGIDDLSIYVDKTPIKILTENVVLRHVFVAMSRSLERLVIVTRGKSIDSSISEIQEYCDVLDHSIDHSLDHEDSVSSENIPAYQYIDYNPDESTGSERSTESERSIKSDKSEGSEILIKYEESQDIPELHSISIYPERSDCSDDYKIEVDIPYILQDDTYIVNDKRYLPFLSHLGNTGYIRKDGKILKYEQRDDLKYLARSAYFLSIAESIDKLQVSYKDQFIPNNIRYILSVDDEYRTFRKNTIYYERALTVYDLQKKKLIEAVNLVHRDAKENTSIPVVSERENCHRFINSNLKEDKEMTNEYLKTIGKWNPENSLIIHWTGMEEHNYDFSDNTHPAVKGKKYQCLDVRKIYELYLLNIRGISSVEERHSSLDNTIQDIFGESMNSLLYHRAHEDTVACLLILLQLI